MSDVALIRCKGDDNFVYTLLEHKNDHFVSTEYGVLPKYDMSKLDIKLKPFRIPEEKYRVFVKIMHSRIGKKIINHLKNNKTEQIINEYLELQIKKYSKTIIGKKEKHYNLLSLINDIREQSLGNTTNKLPKNIIHLTNEDIFNEFVKQGLIRI